MESVVVFLIGSSLKKNSGYIAYLADGIGQILFLIWIQSEFGPISGNTMKDLIDISRQITQSEFENRAIVKSQKLNDPVINGISRVGIYYEGYHFPHTLAELDGYRTIWQSKGRIKAFISPD